MGLGTWNLRLGTWNLRLGTAVCLVVSLVNPGQFLTRIMDVLEREVEKINISRTGRRIMSKLQHL